MVRWYHAIFSGYGFWLPNDLRGSWSDFMYAYELYRFAGPATKVTQKRSYAHDPHDAAAREAKTHLKHPPVRFDAAARDSIAKGFAWAVDEFGFRLHACAIGHDHVHLVSSRDHAALARPNPSQPHAPRPPHRLGQGLPVRLHQHARPAPIRHQRRRPSSDQRTTP